MELPRVIRVRQQFALTPPLDIAATIEVELTKQHRPINAIRA